MLTYLNFSTTSLQAGQRQLPDSGPELLERTITDFELEIQHSISSPVVMVTWSLQTETRKIIVYSQKTNKISV